MSTYWGDMGGGDCKNKLNLDAACIRKKHRPNCRFVIRRLGRDSMYGHWLVLLNYSPGTQPPTPCCPRIIICHLL